MPDPVALATVHHEGAGDPTDVVRADDYTYWIGSVAFHHIQSVWDSYATWNFNGTSFDICLSGNRMEHPVTDSDIELIRGACTEGRELGYLIDNPQVRDHHDSPGSSTVCSGDFTRDVWDAIVAACQADGVPATPPPPERGAMELQRTKSGRGYYVVSADGGVFCYGDAKFHGSMGGAHLNKPIVGMAVRPQDDGYLLVASDGGVFAFGKAPFHGSMGGKHLNSPICDIEFDAEGDGYWMLADDGGIFTFGHTAFYGAPTGKV
jgi:hypothetical protein